MLTYVDHMGCDESVCDAARVSMNKTADLFTVTQNERLINYLARHNHWSPFSHCVLKVRVTAPIFIARQLAKHQVGFSWNEVSRRYVSSDPEFWIPDEFRDKADNVKQGSSNTVNYYSQLYKTQLDTLCKQAAGIYSDMLKDNICPEQARAILPQAMMTEWIWTGSLYAWSRMYNLRSDSHSQVEVRSYAAAIGSICDKYFPLSWRALTNYGVQSE
jgi:thymidylate synthase (FAD)